MNEMTALNIDIYVDGADVDENTSADRPAGR